MVVYVLAFLLYFGINLVRAYGTPGWFWSLAGAGVCSLLYFSYGAMLLGILSQTLETRRRRQQRILVTPTEITLENAPQNFTAMWQDVTDYFIDASADWKSMRPHVVQTKQGAFSFLGSITEAASLCHVVKYFATGAIATEWAIRDKNTLGGPALQWSGGQKGIGARVFHYRTRTIRAVVGGMTFLFLMMPAIYALGNWLNGPLAGNSASTLVLLPPVLAYWVWLWMLYYRARVEVDDAGITQQSPFGKRWQISWVDVHSFQKKESCFLVRGADHRIKILRLRC